VKIFGGKNMYQSKEQNKKKKEIQIVEGFLKTLNIKATIKPFENPDIRATLNPQNSSNTQIVGIEVREHFNDEIPRKSSSQGQRLLSFWQQVQEQIEKLRSNYPQLKEIHASFQLKKGDLGRVSLNSKMVGDFANALVKFILKESETAHSKIIITLDWAERDFYHFTDPLMKKYVNNVKIRKGLIDVKWDADVNASVLNINTEHLCKIIEEKNSKAKKYDRNGLDELWLVIAAPHDNPFNAMHDFPDQIDFHNQEILKVCEKTPFDKIFFWSSPPHEWYKQIWSNEIQS
jgi:hypothetical protein